MRTISLFSGGGGLDLGFQKAGFDIIWANDNEINTVETYKENIGDHIVFGDINEIDLKTIPKAEVVIGGPPCQSFSLSGKRDVNDPRGQLVWRYIDVLKQVNPLVFVFENVTGLLSAKDKDGNKVFDLLKTEFGNIGYKVKSQVLNSVNYGVPQKRKRVIVVGFKVNREYSFPKPTHSLKDKILEKAVIVEDALSDLGSPVKDNELASYISEPKNKYQAYLRTNSEEYITDHLWPTMSELDKYICKHVKPGGNYMDIPPTVDSKRIRRLQKEGGHTTCYGRMDPKQPSYTINTYFNRPNVGCNIHYSEDRIITVREALRIQSFPDNYHIFSKTKKARNTIVGNAVPPLLAYNIALSIKKLLEV